MTVHSRTSSILIFNTGRRADLLECLASICRQEKQPAEVVVIDSGGDCPEEISEFAVNFPIRQVGKITGEGANGNSLDAALSTTQGDYIHFLYSDNSLEYGSLAILEDALNDSGVAVAYGPVHIARGALRGITWGQEFNAFEILNRCVLNENILVNKQFLLTAKRSKEFPKTPVFWCWDMLISLLVSGHEVAYVDRASARASDSNRYMLLTNSDWQEKARSLMEVMYPEYYSDESQRLFKKTHAPSVYVVRQHADMDLTAIMTRQLFEDWTDRSNLATVVYRLDIHSEKLFRGLPPESVASAVAAMEINRQRGWYECMPKSRPGDSNDHETEALEIGPVFTLTRMASEAKQHFCRGAAEHREIPASSACTAASEGTTGDDSYSRIKTVLKNLLQHTGGAKFRALITALHDRIYFALYSPGFSATRVACRKRFGDRCLSVLDRFIYTLLLSQPPSVRTSEDWLDRFVLGNVNRPRLPAKRTGAGVNLMILTSHLEVGGVERIIMDLAACAYKVGINTILVTTRPSSHPWAERARETGCIVYHMDSIAGSNMTSGLQYLVEQYDINVIYIMHSLAGYAAAEEIKNKFPDVLIMDRNEVLEGENDFPHCSLSMAPRAIDIRTAGHRALASTMASIGGLPADAFRVIYHGADLQRIEHELYRGGESLFQLCEVDDDVMIVLFVGRFCAQKRPALFVEIAESVLDEWQGGDVHFAMIGGGEVDTIRSRINNGRYAGNIHLLGSRTDICWLMSQATLLLMPSEYEGLALVSYEAMAVGLPQIFSRVNGQEELITPDTGILVDKDEYELQKFTEACISLLGDEYRRKSMAEAGKKRIREHFTTAMSMAEYTGLCFEHAAAVAGGSRH